LYYADFSQSGPAALIGNDSNTRPADLKAGTYDGLTYLGSGNAVAQPTGDIFAPELKVEINTEAVSPATPEGSIASSQAIIVQRYVNTGSTPITVGLNTAVDWTIQNSQQSPGAFGFGIGYQIQIFEPTSGFIDIDLTSDLNAFFGLSDLFSTSNFPEPVSYYASTSTFYATGTDLLISPLRTLAPGAGFFVATRLSTGAGLGMSVDAFNTMRGTFVDENGNVLDGSSALQAVKVPEPGTISLFGAGLFALGFLRRRRAA
jgi:hypothetical protein